MQRRRLAVVLLHAMLVLVIAAHFATAAWSATLDDDDAEIEATEIPANQPARGVAPADGPGAPAGSGAQGAAPSAPQQAVVSTGNNIIGLNVARLRRDRYIYAAAELVNANGGDWGYLTVVFTASERDGGSGEQLLQELLDRCYEQHLQPIIRVATRFDEGSETWSRPAPDEPEQWRAFLEKGRWPTKHVWLIAGNEPNLGREWGGEVDSATYAAYLSHFIDVFQDSDRFKVVNGALDASNASEMPKMQDAYEFLAGMDAAVPGIFARLAGWASNPYSVPNQGPGLRYTHRAYEAELEAIGRDMPVLITEAGHLNTGDDQEIAAFYEQAFHDWMADPRVVAVTPLFWHPDRGVYWMFDFDKNSKVVDKSPTYDLIQNLPKPRGSPDYTTEIENVARGDPQPSTPKVGELTVALAPPPAEEGNPAEPAPAPTEPPATPTPVPPTPTPIPATPTPVPATQAPATPTPVPPTATPRSAATAVPALATAVPATSARLPAAPTPAPATATPQPAQARYLRIGNTDGDAVRLRGTPSRSAPAIASVPVGTRVQAFGTAERQEDLYWQRVRTPDGTDGWIAIDFLMPD